MLPLPRSVNRSWERVFKFHNNCKRIALQKHACNCPIKPTKFSKFVKAQRTTDKKWYELLVAWLETPYCGRLKKILINKLVTSKNLIFHHVSQICKLSPCNSVLHPLCIRDCNFVVILMMTCLKSIQLKSWVEYDSLAWNWTVSKSSSSIRFNRPSRFSSCEVDGQNLVRTAINCQLFTLEYRFMTIIYFILHVV